MSVVDSSRAPATLRRIAYSAEADFFRIKAWNSQAEASMAISPTGQSQRGISSAVWPPTWT
jgi:hypothetical protein